MLSRWQAAHQQLGKRLWLVFESLMGSWFPFESLVGSWFPNLQTKSGPAGRSSRYKLIRGHCGSRRLSLLGCAW